MTYAGIVKGAFKKFYVSTAAATIGLAVMNLFNIALASLFFGRDGSYTIGLALPIIIFTEIIVYFFGIGGGIAVSIRQGRGEKSEANRLFTGSLLSTLLVGVAAALAALLCLEPLLLLLGARTAAEQAIAGGYIKILLCGMPVVLLCGVMNVFIRNDNNPRFAMLGVLSTVCVNLALIGVFIAILKLPVYSVALAIVLSNSVCAVMYLAYFLGKGSTLKFTRKIKASALKELSEPGFAGSMIFLAQTVLTVIINNVLLAVGGMSGIAAYGVVKYVITFIYAVYDSVNHSAQPMFGVYYGERDQSGLRLTAKIAYRFNFFSSIVLCVALLAATPLLNGLFAMDITEAMRLIAISCLFSSSVAFLNSYYRATGRSRLSLLFIVLDNLLFPALLIYFTVYGLHLGQSGVWLSLLLSEVFTLILIAAATRGRFLLLEKDHLPGEKAYQALIVNDQANIASINEEIERFCDRNGIDQKKQYYIFLCIEEIAVNIIKYGFTDGKEHYIDIRLLAAGENVILNIRDDAIQFDPTAKKDADITASVEERDIGGLGIYLVKKVAKEFSYRRVIGFNNLHIML